MITIKDLYPLLPSEVIILEKCQRGEKADLTLEDEKQVRAEFIRTLLLDKTIKIDPHGVSIVGLQMGEKLDISFLSINFPLYFMNSQFVAIDCMQLQCILLNFDGCSINSFLGDRIVCTGNVSFNNSCKVEGEIRLNGVQIGGALIFSGADLSNPGEDALNCDGADIKGDVFLDEGFKAKGEVRLLGAQIGGALTLASANLSNPNGDALCCDRVSVNGSFFLDHGFKSEGEIRLLGAYIGGTLAFGSAYLSNPGKDALSCYNAYIKGNVFLDNGFKAEGKVVLQSSDILGNLELSDADLSNIGEDVLNCDGVDIRGDIIFNKNFKANGGISIMSAQIGGDLKLSGANLSNHGKNALSCHNANFKGNVFLNNSFNADGKVGLYNTQILGNLVLRKSDISVLICQAVQIKSGLLVDSFTKIDIFDLTAGTANTLVGFAYFNAEKINLDGFEYKHVHGKIDLNRWFQNLPNKENFKPRPYKQLAKVLRDMGHIQDANQVMIKYHDIRPRNGKIYNIFLWIYKLASEYGYKPIRTFIIMIVMWLAFGVVYWFSASIGVFSPTNPLIFQQVQRNYDINVSNVDLCSRREFNNLNNWTLNSKIEGEYTAFSPWLYSLDVILPLVDIQQEKDWGVFMASNDWTFNAFVRLLIVIEVLVGWGLSLILVAILSGLAKNEKD